MTNPLSSELLQSYTKLASASNHWIAFAFLSLLIGSPLGFVVLVVSGNTTLGSFLVMGSIAVGVSSIAVAELKSAGQIHGFLKARSDADLEALLLAPAEAKVWVSGVQMERARRTALGQGSSLTV